MSWLTILIPATLLSPQQAELTVKWESRGSSSEPFTAVSGMAETSSGAILISDAVNGVVYHHDPKANATIVHSRTGRGPNEVVTPTLAAKHPDGGVVVLDIGAARFAKYNGQGEFAGFIPLGGGTVTNPKGLSIRPNGDFILSGGRFRSNHSVFLHAATDGSVRASAIAIPSSRDAAAALQVAGGPVAALDDGSVLYASSAPHGIYKISSDFRTTQLIAQDPSIVPAIVDSFNRQVIVNGRTVIQHDWFYDQARLVAPLANERVLHIITRRKQGDSVWEIWGPGGELQRRLRVPRPYHPFGVTSNGAVLAIYEDPLGEQVAVALQLDEG